jgi:hypothetical protein
VWNYFIFQGESPGFRFQITCFLCVHFALLASSNEEWNSNKQPTSAQTEHCEHQKDTENYARRIFEKANRQDREERQEYF